nr:MAG: EamA family transporter [Pseudomonadota bacterium]
MLIALSILWGGSFLFIGIAVKAVPPLTIVLARVGIAALALNLVLRLSGQRLPLDGRVWAAFAVMGFLNNLIPFSLIVWGQARIPSGVASVLNAMTPVFTVIVAHFLTSDEKLTGNRLAGVALGLAGVAVMIGPAALAGAGADVIGAFAVLLAALSYAFSGIYGRRFRGFGLSPLVVATGQLTATTMMMAPLALVVEQPWTLTAPGPGPVAAIVALALASTALAYILFFRILTAAGAVNLSLVTLLIPVSAVLFGAAFLGETIAMRQLAGMGLIGLGLLAIDGRLFAAMRRSPA